jgi:DNA-binding transcriptional LysR family regulator
MVRIFVKVVQSGSYTRAASLLHLPKSSVSRAVTRIEAESGTKLLMRTTRSITLTAAGRAFYDSCVSPLQQLEEARKSLSGSDNLLSGSVRITAPEDLGASIITPTIAKLSREQLGLNFEMFYTNQRVDLVKDGFDLAIRIGKMSDSQLKAKKLGDICLILVAAPRFLEKNKVKNPADLLGLPCLSYGPRYRKTKWQLRSAKARKTLNFEAKIVCNQMSSLVSLAREGAGVAIVPEYLCRTDIAQGTLRHILPAYYEDEYPVYLVSPFGVQSSARIKMSAELLTQEIKKLLG